MVDWVTSPNIGPSLIHGLTSLTTCIVVGSEVLKKEVRKNVLNVLNPRKFMGFNHETRNGNPRVKGLEPIGKSMANFSPTRLGVGVNPHFNRFTRQGECCN